MKNTDWDKLAFPRLCGLLGRNPSRLSQAMHNAGFGHFNLDFSYHAFNTLETGLALKAVRELGFRGLSLTIPHKEIAFDLVDEISEDAKKIGAINTLINSGDTLHGYNSDWFGVCEALKEISFEAKKTDAYILGAGGAARAGVHALTKLGLRSVTISNRTIERAQQVANDFSDSSNTIQTIEYADLQSAIDKAPCLIMNATPIGLKAEEESSYPFSFSSLTKTHTVFDMVTKDTALTVAARERGASTVLGIRMLLHQALKQFELFTEKKAPLEVMEKALMQEYKQQNR